MIIIKERLKETIEWVKSFDYETVKYLKYALFGLILVDFFGIYWYFKLKRIGIGFLIVLIFLFFLILMIERR